MALCLGVSYSEMEVLIVCLGIYSNHVISKLAFLSRSSQVTHGVSYLYDVQSRDEALRQVPQIECID